MVKDILESHNVYALDLEIELLRHYEKLIFDRNSQDNIERNDSADGKNKKVSLPCGENNKQRVKFTFHNSPYFVGYKCNCPGDMSGEYIRVG